MSKNPADVLGNDALRRFTEYNPPKDVSSLYGRGFDPTKSKMVSDGKVQNPSPANKFSTETLEFPTGVASGNPGFGNHGHFIMFYINSQTNAKLRIGSETGKGSVADDPSQKYNVGKWIKEWTNIQQSHVPVKKNTVKKNINDNTPVYGGPDAELEAARKASFSKGIDERDTQGGSTIRVKRKPTKRLSTAIAMYMPSTVQVKYGARYEDEPIGNLTEGALQAYSQAMAGSYRGAAESVVNLDKDIQNMMKTALLSTVGIIPGFAGAQAVFEMKEGVVLSDRLELAFKNIEKRSFSYSFKMTPKNKTESDMIRRIIFAFKSNMLPEFVGGNRSGRRMVVPNTFDIQYMYCGKSNHYLHHISTCVLEGMDVSYGGDRYKTFDAQSDGAPPVETSISLTFKEIELITRERVHEGY